jgi:hypothetical protein
MSLERVDCNTIPAGAKPGFDHADTHRPGRCIYVAHTGADSFNLGDPLGTHCTASVVDLASMTGLDRGRLFCAADAGALVVLRDSGEV